MSAAPDGDRVRDRWSLLATLTIHQAGLSFVRIGLAVLAPFLRDDFDLSLAQVGLLFLAFDLGALVAFLPLGFLGDRGGGRPVLVLAGLLTAGVAVVASTTSAYWLLALALCVAGLSYPSAQTSGSRLVLLAFPSSLRGFAIGIRQTGVSVGAVCASLLLAPAAEAWGWRNALLASALAPAVGGLLCWRRIPTYRIAVRTDSFGRSIALLIRNRAFVAAAVGGSLIMPAEVTVRAFYALDLVDRFGWTATDAARSLALLHVGGGVGRLLWGRVSDGGGPARRVSVMVWLIAAATALLLWLAWGSGGWLAVYLLPLLGGVILQGWAGVHTTLMMEVVGAGLAATAIGLSMTALYVVAAMAPLGFGVLVDESGSYALGWLTVALLTTFAIPLFRRVGAQASEQPSEKSDALPGRGR